MSTTTTTGTLYVYGDSYSETTTSKRKTNGPVWSERVAKGWGLQLHSYAISGSRACRVSGVNSPSVASQVEFYKKAANPSIEQSDMKDVHAFFIGVTDIISSTKYQAASLVGCIKQQIADIHKTDPHAQILLLGIPPLEYSPFYSNNTKHEQIKKRVNEYNVELEDAVMDLGSDTSSFIDNNYLFADILGNPSGYGLDDVDNAYWNQCQGRCGDSMDTYLWWDAIHLTGAGHKAIAYTVITKNPFGYSIIKETSSTFGNNNNGNGFGDSVGVGGTSGNTMGGFLSSEFYVHYAPWALLACVLLIVVIMIRPRYGLHLAVRTLCRRGKPHVYSSVPV